MHPIKYLMVKLYFDKHKNRGKSEYNIFVTYFCRTNGAMFPLLEYPHWIHYWDFTWNPKMNISISKNDEVLHNPLFNLMDFCGGEGDFYLWRSVWEISNIMLEQNILTLPIIILKHMNKQWWHPKNIEQMRNRWPSQHEPMWWYLIQCRFQFEWEENIELVLLSSKYFGFCLKRIAVTK